MEIRQMLKCPSSCVPSLRGVNVVPFLEMIGFPESLVGLLRDSSSGYALTAYAMYKVISSRILWVFIDLQTQNIK